MKKIATLLTVAVLGAAMTFAQVGVDGKKEEAKSEASDVKTLQLAYELADYGYENDSASALLQAAEMIAQVKTQAAKVEAKKNGTSGAKAPEETKGYSAQALVDAAKKLAGKDKALLDWAKDIEKAAKTATRGATGGPLYNANFAYANGGNTYYDWYFDGGRLAEVAVHSMDGADLDLYVYDQNGNIITYDESYGPNAYCSWTPRWTGTFRIFVKNNARYNATFEIVTN